MSYPKALGPYSVSQNAGDIVFLSGQLPLKGDELITDDIKEATRQCFRNIEAVLKERNLELKNLVKVNVFLTNIDDFAAVNEAYAEFFDGNYPARSCVEVSNLPKNSPIEIESIAYAK